MPGSSFSDFPSGGSRLSIFGGDPGGMYGPTFWFEPSLVPDPVRRPPFYSPPPRVWKRLHPYTIFTQASSLRRQVQKSSSSNTRSKTPGRRQIEWRRRTGSGTRLINTIIVAVVLGVSDRLLEELVFCVCLLRGAASHKKRLPTRFTSSSVISITITIFMQP